MFTKGEDIVPQIEGIIHEETQVDEKGLDLTLNKIYTLQSRGELDFSGGERKDGRLEEIDPKKRTKHDDYGWWELEGGLYEIEYNEKLRPGGDELGIVIPLGRLTRNGAFHPAIPADICLKGTSPLIVGKQGLSIKENSRISKLVAWGYNNCQS